MKIAYLCSDFGIPPFGTNGAANHIREVVRALQQLGHEVRVYSPAIVAAENGDPETYRPVPLSGMAAEVLPTLYADVPQPEHLANEYSRLLYNEQLRDALAPELEEWRPNFLYERYSLFGYAGLELAGRFGLPHLLEVNAPLAEEQEQYRILALKKTAEELERRILTGASAVLVVSEALARFVESVGVKRHAVTILPNAVDPERFAPDVEPEESVRAGLGEKVVGFVGSLKAWHDIETMIAAVRLLHDGDPSYRLLIVGDGPRMAELQSVDAPFLRLHGAVENQRVPSLLAAMDVVVVPYAREGHEYFSPLKLFEAMAMAKPVVGACIGQVEAVISHGVDGLLYDPGDAADLARKIQAIFGMPDRGRALGVAARAKVLRRHTWRRNAETIVSIAQLLLSAPVGRAT
jgi:glycosyltransferase involved in cell wall biosynthesis